MFGAADGEPVIPIAEVDQLNRRPQMDTTRPFEAIDHHRRHFVGTAAMAIAAAQLGMLGSASAETQLPPIKPGTNTSLGPLKQIDAGVLNVGYAEVGPANGA